MCEYPDDYREYLDACYSVELGDVTKSYREWRAAPMKVFGLCRIAHQLSHVTEEQVKAAPDEHLDYLETMAECVLAWIAGELDERRAVDKR